MLCYVHGLRVVHVDQDLPSSANPATGCTLTDESRPTGGFILAETLVMTGTAGKDGTAGGTLYPSVLGYLVG